MSSLDHFICQDSSGREHAFWCEARRDEIERDVFKINVARTNPLESGEDYFFFEFKLVSASSGKWRVDVVDRNGQQWAHRKGIIKRAFELAARMLGGVVVSSLPGETPFRTCAAEAMWEGLEKAQCAYRDSADGRWVFIPDHSNKP